MVLLYSNKTQTKIPSVVAGTFNPNTQEVEAGLSFSSRMKQWGSIPNKQKSKDAFLGFYCCEETSWPRQLL